MSIINIDFNLYCKKLYKKNANLSDEVMAQLLFFVYDEYVNIYKKDLEAMDLNKCPDFMTIENHKIVIKNCSFSENKRSITEKLNCNPIDRKIIADVWHKCSPLGKEKLQERLESHAVYKDCCKDSEVKYSKVTPSKLLDHRIHQDELKHATMMEAMEVI